MKHWLKIAHLYCFYWSWYGKNDWLSMSVTACLSQLESLIRSINCIMGTFLRAASSFEENVWLFMLYTARFIFTLLKICIVEFPVIISDLPKNVNFCTMFKVYSYEFINNSQVRKRESKRYFIPWNQDYSKNKF